MHAKSSSNISSNQLSIHFNDILEESCLMQILFIYFIYILFILFYSFPLFILYLYKIVFIFDENWLFMF